MSKQRKRSWKPFITIVGVFVGVVGWLTLLWPPVKYFYEQQNGGFFATLRELLKPENSIYDDGVFVGYVFLIASLLLIIAVPIAVAQMLSRITRYVERSEADVSLLQLDLTLRFDELLHSCTIVRQQLFHANQPNTSAYHYNQSVDNDGARIDASSFEMNSRIANERITSDYIIRSHPKRFEAIELFKRSLPTSWLATYLPDWIVLFLYNHTSILDKAIVERVGEIVLTGDHDGDQPFYELHSPKRRARNITITLDFPNATAPKPADVQCFIIRDNVVYSIYPKCNPVGDRRVYTAFVSVLDHEKMRVQWSNARLFAVKEAIAASKAAPPPCVPESEPALPDRKRPHQRLFSWLRAIRNGASAGQRGTALGADSSRAEDIKMASTDHV